MSFSFRLGRRLCLLIFLRECQTPASFLNVSAFVGSLPCELRLAPSHVSVCCGLSKYRPKQVQFFDHLRRCQSEVFSSLVQRASLRSLSTSRTPHKHRHWLCDSIACKLHFAPVAQPCGDEVLRDISCHVRSGPIYFGRVLS